MATDAASRFAKRWCCRLCLHCPIKIFTNFCSVDVLVLLTVEAKRMDPRQTAQWPRVTGITWTDKGEICPHMDGVIRVVVPRGRGEICCLYHCHSYGKSQYCNNWAGWVLLLLLGVGGFIDEWKCSLLRSVTVGGANWKEEWLQGSQWCNWLAGTTNLRPVSG